MESWKGGDDTLLQKGKSVHVESQQGSSNFRCNVCPLLLLLLCSVATISRIADGIIE